MKGISYKPLYCRYRRITIQPKRDKAIARSIYHILTSVDRCIRDFERVKLLFAKGMSQSEIAHIASLLECLVTKYIKIVKMLILKK